MMAALKFVTLGMCMIVGMVSGTETGSRDVYSRWYPMKQQVLVPKIFNEAQSGRKAVEFGPGTMGGNQNPPYNPPPFYSGRKSLEGYMDDEGARRAMYQQLYQPQDYQSFQPRPRPTARQECYQELQQQVDKWMSVLGEKLSGLNNNINALRNQVSMGRDIPAIDINSITRAMPVHIAGESDGTLPNSMLVRKTINPPKDDDDDDDDDSSDDDSTEETTKKPKKHGKHGKREKHGKRKAATKKDPESEEVECEADDDSASKSQDDVPATKKPAIIVRRAFLTTKRPIRVRPTPEALSTTTAAEDDLAAIVAEMEKDEVTTASHM